MPDNSPLTRIIAINGETILDAINGQADEMTGDPILHQRIDAILARDCARRKLLALLLPALDESAKIVLRDEVYSWKDPTIRTAAEDICAQVLGKK